MCATADRWPHGEPTLQRDTTRYSAYKGRHPQAAVDADVDGAADPEVAAAADVADAGTGATAASSWGRPRGRRVHMGRVADETTDRWRGRGRWAGRAATRTLADLMDLEL